MGTKNEPGKFDCYVNAEPDEPMFILLARDAHAPRAVETWASNREFMIVLDRKPKSDRAMVVEARQCADAMRTWRKTHRPDGATAEDIPMVARAFTEFASDPDGLDTDQGIDQGIPGIGTFSNALQIWVLCQHPREISVALAAETFNVEPRLIIGAVAWHPWMFITGPDDDHTRQIIEHDGE